ncbi:endonuclease/exonuclease/phosphatase family protein [Enterococcus sp. CSURQ0835]|uniref:endonuclease/exonuclease/phosphatase family protein n=1 Tax=Enterococcus sp. CSURQ0835 TaxID=2681394 RepID=UPI0013587A79|nr:endonuclease/exonuclease/phosphatase family protein [Enterococcus sp. CSURQ0835]
MKKIFRFFIGIFTAVLLLLVCYIGYLFLSYHRLPAEQQLAVHTSPRSQLVKDKTYRAMTYNIGYGSYPPNYSFFMDGGKKARATSKQVVRQNLNGIIQTTQQIDPTLAFYQEVDQAGDRSRHVNEVQRLKNAFPDYASVYGQNYDSSYLFYPLTEPIGKAKSGLVTLSRTTISQSRRYSLPIETDFNKFFDLDRAFTASVLPVKNGRYLIAINTHLSAYTKNKKIQQAQLDKLFTFMSAEAKKGNYVLVAGDFNHDLLGNSPQVFHTSHQRLSWTHPFPTQQLPVEFTQPQSNLAQAKIPSARNLNEPYRKGHTLVTLIDGFFVSDNITVKTVRVRDTGFAYSDHNPVEMTFSLH